MPRSEIPGMGNSAYKRHLAAIHNERRQANKQKASPRTVCNDSPIVNKPLKKSKPTIAARIWAAITTLWAR